MSLDVLQLAPPCDLQAFRARLGAAAAARNVSGAVYMHFGHRLNPSLDARALPAPQRLHACGGFDDAEYARRGHLQADPLVRRASGALAPFRWSLEDFTAADEGELRLLAALRRWGVHAGVVAPVQDYALGPALLNLYVASDRAPEMDEGQLMLVATELHLMATVLRPAGSADGEDGRLNGREVSVLRKAAIGLTESETAQALSLSRRGVQFHLARAMQKLDAPNKTAAVARAVSLGLIRL